MTVCHALKPTASAPRRSTGSGGSGLSARIARSRLWTTFTWTRPKNNKQNKDYMTSKKETEQRNNPSKKQRNTKEAKQPTNSQTKRTKTQTSKHPNRQPNHQPNNKQNKQQKPIQTKPSDQVRSENAIRQYQVPGIRQDT